MRSFRLHDMAGKGIFCTALDRHCDTPSIVDVNKPPVYRWTVEMHTCNLPLSEASEMDRHRELALTGAKLSTSTIMSPCRPRWPHHYGILARRSHSNTNKIYTIVESSIRPTLDSDKMHFNTERD